MRSVIIQLSLQESEDLQFIYASANLQVSKALVRIQQFSNREARDTEVFQVTFFIIIETIGYGYAKASDNIKFLH
jgi:hypothetical protein